MARWNPSAGRITLFSAPTSRVPSALNLFQTVWRADPDGFQKQNNPLVPTIAQGRRGNLVFACIVQPGRIDLSLTPPPSPAGTPDESYPVIEDDRELHNEMLRIAEVVAREQVAENVSRVAVSKNFLNLTENFVEANKELLTIMPAEYRPKLKDEEDFLFQVNRPYSSGRVPNVTINVLIRWSVDRLGIISIALPMRSPNTVMAAPVSATPETKTFIGASVSFDLNNVPTERLLAPHEQAAIVDEALASITLVQPGVEVSNGVHNVRQ